jgi:hypothetical protein
MRCNLLRGRPMASSIAEQHSFAVVAPGNARLVFLDRQHSAHRHPAPEFIWPGAKVRSMRWFRANAVDALLTLSRLAHWIKASVPGIYFASLPFAIPRRSGTILVIEGEETLSRKLRPPTSKATLLRPNRRSLRGKAVGACPRSAFCVLIEQLPRRGCSE